VWEPFIIKDISIFCCDPITQRNQLRGREIRSLLHRGWLFMQIPVAANRPTIIQGNTQESFHA